ncbi:MAG: TolC family protein [Gammaproteobacteria bacterium]|nr:TolC family protein [Gammaproteobacteria bacterium]
MKKIFYYLICLISMHFMNGCTLYKKPDAPDLKNPQSFKSKIKITSANLKDHWWENFHDEKLNQLLLVAFEKNNNYKISLKNIDIAATYVTQNLSNLFPQVNLDFNSSRNQYAAAQLNSFGGLKLPNASGSNLAPRPFDLQQLSGVVSYQVDAWNQIRNSVKQAEANQSASEADSQQVKLMLISSITNTYFQINAASTNIVNLNKQLKSANAILKLDTAQFQGGLIDFSVIDDDKNQIESIKTSIITLEKQKQILEYTLAYLSGEYPENFNLKIHNGFNEFKKNNLIPAGIPAKMIANRPDIQEAYYQVLSYGYLEKQTIANFLPSISLTGAYGYASTALSHLISGPNAYWNYGLFTTQYVFDYATRLSEYRRSKYQYQSAILNYKNIAINAFKEVDSALSSYKKDNESFDVYQNQYVILKDKLMLANAQYRSGLTGYSEYLTSNLHYLQSEYALTNQKLTVMQDVIQVYTALGLGT